VPLIEGVLNGAGRFHYSVRTAQRRPSRTSTLNGAARTAARTWSIPLVSRLVEEGKQVIVFREINGETVGCAGYLAARLGLPAAQEALDALPSGDPSTSSDRLRGALRGGVAFHNADLNRAERQTLEEAFHRKGTNLRVLVATTTLVHTPRSPPQSGSPTPVPTVEARGGERPPVERPRQSRVRSPLRALDRSFLPRTGAQVGADAQLWSPPDKASPSSRADSRGWLASGAVVRCCPPPWPPSPSRINRSVHRRRRSANWVLTLSRPCR
jgi:replicative superfamily II helicase